MIGTQCANCGQTRGGETKDRARHPFDNSALIGIFQGFQIRSQTGAYLCPGQPEIFRGLKNPILAPFSGPPPHGQLTLLCCALCVCHLLASASYRTHKMADTKPPEANSFT